MLSCSIGLMAYNEEANIGFALEALLNQSLSMCKINEIIVVASGCTDRTVEIVEDIAKSDKLVSLIVQDKRCGKASAINMFLSVAKGEIIVIESADTVPEKDTVEKLVQPFHDPDVGMSGAHPVPVNPENTFMGFTTHLFWRLHHELSLKHPKGGELIAFRNIFREISANTAVDEASIEAIITEAGYRIYYAKDAIVRNKGPETVKDFIKQRRRIMLGHKYLQKTYGYSVSTMKIGNLLGLFNRIFKNRPINFKVICWTIGAVFLELYGRLLGDFDFHLKKKSPFAWEIAESTKNLQNDANNS